MKMKKLRKCSTAAVTLLSLLLAACNGAAKPASSAAPDVTGARAESIAFENVYAETQLPVEYHGYGNSVVCAGERIYYSTTLRSEGEPGGDAVTETQKLISCDLDGGDEKIHWEQTAETAEGASAVENTQLPAFDADADGNLWLVLSEPGSDDGGEDYESKTRLVKLAPDGTEIFNTELSLPGDAQSGSLYGANLERDAAGNIYLHAQDIHVFS
ncbi:MAG: hypothetical protein LBL25_02425, partial [Oscillospiraceae bacterium]|nr:hypothetical protein [Oscillospiraceae bacterium]